MSNNDTSNHTTLWAIEYRIASGYVWRHGCTEAFLVDAKDHQENKLYTTRRYAVTDFEFDYRATSKIHYLIAQREWHKWLDKCTAAQE